MNKETCILCGRVVDIDVSTSTDLRHFYVEGAGQLCEKCYEKTYGGENNDPDNYPPEY